MNQFTFDPDGPCPLCKPSIGNAGYCSRCGLAIIPGWPCPATPPEQRWNVTRTQQEAPRPRPARQLARHVRTRPWRHWAREVRARVLHALAVTVLVLVVFFVAIVVWAFICYKARWL